MDFGAVGIGGGKYLAHWRASTHPMNFGAAGKTCAEPVEASARIVAPRIE